MTKTNQKNKKKHLTFEERYTVEKMLNKGKKQKEIAEILERGMSTISEEISRGKVLNSKTGIMEYIAKKANHKAYSRQYWKKKNSLKISPYLPICKDIDKRIVSGQSPESISGWIRENEDKRISKYYVSPKAIRKYVNKSRPSLARYLFWNRVKMKTGPKRSKTSFLSDKQRKTMITRTVIFPHLEEEFGHWEMDFIVSKHNKYVLLVLVEKLTRKVLIKKLKTRKNSYVNRIIVSMLKHEIVKSITTDNDIAFTKWKMLEHRLNTNIFFTDPYCSWQKGLVENTNRWIRQFLPKRTDFKKVIPSYLRIIEEWLNNQPKGILNWKTAEENYQLFKNNVKIKSLVIPLPKMINF